MRIVRRGFGEVPDTRYRTLTGDAFFVSRGFSELWRSRGGEPCIWCAEADGALIGVLPGVEFRRGPLRRFASMPDGCYSGVFVAAEAEPERDRCTRELLTALTRRYAVADIFDFDRAMKAVPGYVRRVCEARLISLTGPDWMPADPTLDQQARKASREGIRIEHFDAGHHLTGLMQLAEETARAHGCWQRYPRAFFAGLSALARDDERIIWRWCAHEGAPAASQIYIAEDGTLMAWQSYFDRRFSFLKPNQAMRLEVCRTFAAAGGRMLNLGSTPRRAIGLAAYKRRWGGRLVPYPDHSWNALAGLPATLRDLMAAPAAAPRNEPAGARRTGALPH